MHALATSKRSCHHSLQGTLQRLLCIPMLKLKAVIWHLRRTQHQSLRSWTELTVLEQTAYPPVKIPKLASRPPENYRFAAAEELDGTFILQSVTTMWRLWCKDAKVMHWSWSLVLAHSYTKPRRGIRKTSYFNCRTDWWRKGAFLLCKVEWCGRYVCKCVHVTRAHCMLNACIRIKHFIFVVKIILIFCFQYMHTCGSCVCKDSNHAACTSQ